MAISQEIWNKAKALFEQGLSLSEIELETEIKRSSISKKAKQENWNKSINQQLKADIKAIDNQKSTLDAKINTTVEKLSKLSDFEITILDEQIYNETGIKSLLFSTANLSLIRKNQMLTKNTKQVLDYETFYNDDGKPISKKPVAVDIELSPIDYKSLDDGIDRNAITLEFAPRHAPKVEVKTGDDNSVNTPMQINIIRDI